MCWNRYIFTLIRQYFSNATTPIWLKKIPSYLLRISQSQFCCITNIFVSNSCTEINFAVSRLLSLNMISSENSTAPGIFLTALTHSDTTKLNPNVTYMQEAFSSSITKQMTLPSLWRNQQFCRSLEEFPSSHLEPVFQFCSEFCALLDVCYLHQWVLHFRKKHLLSRTEIIWKSQLLCSPYSSLS